MSLSAASRRLFPVSFLAVALVLSGCSGSGLALTTQRTQGYSLSQDALAQIRPGQSQELVTMVLGSPQTTNSFTNETAYYYVQTKIEQTAFGLDMVKDRIVLAVYFDKDKRVADKAVYGIKDGKVFQIESRRTPSFGEDRTFVESIIKSF
jgi:outer membrane protein assembly factor BamE (lipoprotein component of BamABCDE complex)